MKKIILTFCFSFFVFYSWSQNYVDILKVYHTYGVNSKFDSSSNSTNYRETGLDFTLPIKLNKKTAILSGVLTEAYRFKINATTNSFENLYSTGIKLGINQKFSEKLNATFMVIPRLTSTHKFKLSNKDYQTIGIAQLKYQRKPNLKYNIGVIYITDLGGPFFVPIFGLYYQSPSKKWEMNYVLPLWADANYKITKWLWSGVNFKSALRSFYLGNEQNSYLALLITELNAYLKFGLTKNILLETKVGTSFLRSARTYRYGDQYDVGISIVKLGDDREQLNTDFEDGLIYKLRLIYRFHL